MTTQAVAKSSDRGGALSFPVVIGVFALLMALGIAFAFRIHRSYVGFERVAARHVPPDAALVVRWDVEKVSLFEPTRRFLLPLLEWAPPFSPTPRESRRDRFAKQGGALLGRDLREVLATFGPGADDWSVVLAGSFPAGDLVSVASRVLRADGNAWRSVGSGRIAAPSGAALGQAADGVLVLASSLERLDATLTNRPLLPEIPRLGAGSLALRSMTGVGLPSGSSEVLGPLGAVTDLEGQARWGTPLPVTLTVRFAGAPPSDATGRIRRSLGALLGEDLARLERTLAPLVVKPAGNQALRVELFVDDMALERAAKRASEAAERALDRGPGQKLP